MQNKISDIITTMQFQHFSGQTPQIIDNLSMSIDHQLWLHNYSFSPSFYYSLFSTYPTLSLTATTTQTLYYSPILHCITNGDPNLRNFLHHLFDQHSHFCYILSFPIFSKQHLPESPQMFSVFIYIKRSWLVFISIITFLMTKVEQNYLYVKLRKIAQN